MEFLNEPVEISNLPRAEELSLVPVEPAYLKLMRVEWAITVLLLLLAGIALITFIKPMQDIKWIALTAAAWLLIALPWYFLQHKSFNNKAYAIRDKDIIYQTGWLIQRIHTCPFNRIQHSTVTIGPLERRWGLATLVLYTAGSNSADLHIAGLQEETARSLKAWITKKIADEPAEI